MKIIFTLLLSTIFTTAFAYDEGRLSITVAANKNVQVFVDGRVYNEKDNSIVLNNIRPGNHSIRIYRAKQNGNRRNRSNRSKNELIYSSTVFVRPSYHVDVMINRFGKAMVDEKALSDRDNWNDDKDDYYEDSFDNNYRLPMTSYDFDQLVENIKTQWFSSGKLNTAKDAIPRNFFSTGQVGQLLQLFTSDNDKLEIAKLAYRFTIDQRNYYSLYDVFSFQSSRDELDRYVKAYRN